MRNLNGRLDRIADAVRNRDGASGWRTAIRFAGGITYLIPIGQTTEKYPNENACIVAELETVGDGDSRNVIVFDYVPSVVSTRGKSAAEIDAEIDAASDYWGDIIIIDR